MKFKWQNIPKKSSRRLKINPTVVENKQMNITYYISIPGYHSLNLPYFPENYFQEESGECILNPELTVRHMIGAYKTYLELLNTLHFTLSNYPEITLTHSGGEMIVGGPQHLLETLVERGLVSKREFEEI